MINTHFAELMGLKTYSISIRENGRTSCIMTFMTDAEREKWIAENPPEGNETYSKD